VRRIAFITLAAVAALVLLFTGAAWAPQSIELTIINESSRDVKIEVFQRPDSFQRHRFLSRLHHKVNPDRSFHASGIEPGSCVLVRVVNDPGNANVGCQNNPTPVDVRCEVPMQYSCKVHRRDEKDVVVKIVQTSA
jgi:hypothetical protein